MTKNAKKLTYIVLLVLCIFPIIYFLKFTNLEPYDELWNFQNVYKMYNGLTLYTNANAIITPLFYYIALFFLKIFGATIFSFRLLNIVLYAISSFLIYRIFKKLEVSTHLAILYVTIMFTQVIQVIFSGANYNTLAFIFIYIGIINYLKNDNQVNHYFQGFIIFLVFISKQTLGAYYALGILIYDFIYKESFAEYIKNQLKKFLTFIIPCVLVSLLFYLNGNLFDFINYAFGGIINFGESNLFFNCSAYLIVLCIISIVLYIFVFKAKKIFTEQNLTPKMRKNLVLLGCVAFTTTLLIFPIINSAHVVFVLPLYFVIFFYILGFMILEDFLQEDKYIIIINIVSICIMIALIVKLALFFFIEKKDYIPYDEKGSPFYGAYIDPEFYEKIKTMKLYIASQEKKVVIVAYDSAFTMVEIGQNNDEFDLVFNGNLGYDGQNKLIEKIKNSENTQYLVFTDEDDMFWQDSTEVRNYIINNLTKVGEILNYSIYE